MARRRAGGQHRQVMLGQRHQRLVELGDVHQHVGEARARPARPKSRCTDGRRRSQSIEQHPLLELLRHRQREVGGGQALAVSLVRAGDGDGAQRAAAFRALEAGAQRSVLLGGQRGRRERGDEMGIELRRRRAAGSSGAVRAADGGSSASAGRSAGRRCRTRRPGARRAGRGTSGLRPASREAPRGCRPRPRLVADRSRRRCRVDESASRHPLVYRARAVLVAQRTRAPHGAVALGLAQNVLNAAHKLNP